MGVVEEGSGGNVVIYNPYPPGSKSGGIFVYRALVIVSLPYLLAKIVPQ